MSASKSRNTPTPFRNWLETLTLTALGLGFGLYRNGDDQLLSAAVAAWLVLVPVLCAAQHGMLHGLASAAIVCAIALRMPLAADSGGAFSAELYNWAFVYIGIGAVVGLCRDMAERRVIQSRHKAEQLQERLQRLERAFNTLRLSHTELEQRLCVQTSSLDAVLDAAMFRMQSLGTRRELGELMLEVLASRANIQGASLFEAHAGRLGSEALAVLGVATARTHEHPFVVRAANSGKLISVIDPSARASAPPGVLAAVPLTCSRGQLRFVLAIHHMAFEAFQAEQLRNMYALAARLSDFIADRLGALNALNAPPSQRAADPSALGRTRSTRSDELWAD